MGDLITRFTALPNLHPAVVHFPIALLPMAALFDLLLLALPRQRGWLDRGAAILYAAAGLGAGAAYWAGERAADSLGKMAPQLQIHLNEHSDSAHDTLWLVGLVAAVRVGLTLWDRTAERRAPRALLLAVTVAGVVLLFRTADLGGSLVYRHGLAVARESTEGADQPAPSGADRSAPSSERPSGEGEPAGSRLIDGADGSLEWTPLPGDREALGSVLRPAPESDLGGVRWIASEGDGDGLALRVDGQALLLLPGTFGDVQVEADLELDSFEGEVGLAHHVRTARNGGLFRVSVPGARFVLESRSGDETEILGEASGELPSGTLRLVVSGVGRHLRGLLNDELVVHGHEPPLADGGCGLYLHGSGRTRILRMRITPVAE